MNIKWLHAPGHAHSIGPKVIEFARNLNPTVIDFSETYWNLSDVRDVLHDWHIFAGSPKRRDARGRIVNFDVVVALQPGVEILHTEEFFVSGEVKQNLKYMPERWGKAIVFEVDGFRVLGIFWHPQPNPFRWLRLVLPKYKRGVERVENKQRELEAGYQPDLVLNGGDLQLGPGSKWAYPNQMAARLNMWVKREKIDWQMWKGNVFKLVTHQIIDPSKINKGMDHLWMMLNLHAKNK